MKARDRSNHLAALLRTEREAMANFLLALADFHGLVDLLLVAAVGVDRDWGLQERLDQVYAEGRRLLGGAKGAAH